MHRSPETSASRRCPIRSVLGELPVAFVRTVTTPLFGSELGVKGGAALALTSSNQAAQASIDGGSGTAPSIYAADVSVISRTPQLCREFPAPAIAGDMVCCIGVTESFFAAPQASRSRREAKICWPSHVGPVG